MATVLVCNTTLDLQGYNSTRVFNGVRQLDEAASQRHKARLMKALANRKCKQV